MADQPNPNPPPAADPKPAPDGQGKNPADQPKGADTPPANPPEAKPDSIDVTQTPEFKTALKDALTNAIREKMPHLHKQARKEVAKELSGEQEGELTVEQLKQQMSERDTKLAEKDARLRVFEARDQLETFAADKRNQITISNFRGVFKLIKDDLKFDDEGNVTNFKDALAAAKAEAPEFFRGTSSSIDAGNGSRQFATADMNTLIRGR